MYGKNSKHHLYNKSFLRQHLLMKTCSVFNILIYFVSIEILYNKTQVNIELNLEYYSNEQGERTACDTLERFHRKKTFSI